MNVQDHDTAIDGVSGFVPEGWSSVLEAFRFALSCGAEGSGAAISVYVNGREVASLVGGEDGRGRIWAPATRAVVWSCTKGMLAALVQRLVDSAVVDVRLPVSRYWPEFSENGKGGVTLEHVLTHTAGLPYWDGYADVVSLGSDEGWDRTEEICDALAAAPLQWAPGQHLGYHGFTYGWILGEVVRRALGKDVGTALREEVAGPLAAEISVGSVLGFDAAETLAPVVNASPSGLKRFDARNRVDTLAGKALLMGSNRAMRDVHITANASSFRTGLAAGGNGIASARGLARMYGALANGGILSDGPRLFSPSVVRAFAGTRVFMPDLVNHEFNRFGLGYQKSGPLAFLGPHDDAYGHAGLGGQLGFADPTARMGFAFVSNQPMICDGWDPRLGRLVSSIYSVVAPSPVLDR